MSFWQNGNQPDLSVTGTATSRHQRPPSGRRGRPNSAGRGGSTKSHIFGISDTPRPAETDKKPGSFHNNSTVSGSVYSTPEAPRLAGGNQIKSVTTPLANASLITKSQLQATKNLAAQRDPSYVDQPVEVQVFSRSGKGGRKAPLGVPQLQLGNLADDNNQLVNPLTAGHPHLHSPDSNSSVVSWGTPISPSRRFQPGPGKPKHGGQQDRAKGSQATPSRIRPDDMPALDLDESQKADDLQQTLQAVKKDDKDCQEHGVRFEKEPSKGESSYPINQEHLIDSNMTADQYNRPWSTQPATHREVAQYRTREEQDVMHSEKKKDLVVEAVLLDQLSRAAVSDPQKCSTSIPVDVGPKQRKQMEFYNTRSPSRGPTAENALAKRVRFGARIVTKNGHDAHRELNGFFFSADSTLTIYEFHQFGTRASALPFIQRGCYSHVQGRKKGKEYSLLDISVGSSLSFLTASQMSLPQNIRHSPVVVFRITDVDEQARTNQLLDSCHTLDDRRKLAETLENPFSESEVEQLEILENVQSIVKKQLQKRAVKTLMGLGQHFRKLDKSGDGVLDRSELQQALETYHIRVPDEASDYLWSILDINGDGFLDYGEFIRGFIGEMNELRKSVVRKVFRKLDPSKNGIVNLNNIRKFYCTKKHPKVLSGEAQERQIEDAFLSSFELCENKGQVTFAEFEDYYEGVSIGLESDEEFVAMMRNCWGV